jgi:hypothetical protein
MKHLSLSTILILVIIGFSMNISAQLSSNGEPYQLFFPFSIHVDPMEKLLLVNFENDPDSVYTGFEPQVFDDSIHGKGHLVIGWRKDKKVDVYHQKSLQLDPATYSITGEGLNKMIPVDMHVSQFEVNENGVQAHYAFTDIFDRRIEIKINENSSRTRKPFGILAPMGDATAYPTSMPLVFLHDFYFVRRKHSDITLMVDSKAHVVDQLPVPMDWQRMTFIRYSPNPLIATLNPSFDGVFEPIEILQGQTEYLSTGFTLKLEWIDKVPHVKAMEVYNDIHPLTLSFKPALPCLSDLSTGNQLEGKFHISGHASIGTVSGSYFLNNQDGVTKIRVVPSKGWKPKTTKLSTWFLFTMAKIFKKWPTTYQWDAEVRSDERGNWQMHSEWVRTGRIAQE